MSLRQSPSTNGQRQLHKRAPKVSKSVGSTANQAQNDVQRPFMQRKCSCGGGCAGCQKDKERIQAKLTIGQPDDKYEREADSVADSVMRQPAGLDHSSVSTSPIPSIQRVDNQHLSMLSRMGETEQEEDLMQTKSSVTSHDAPSDIDSGVRSLKGAGRPLSVAESQFFEPRFHRSFPDVRIHTSGKANHLAKSVNAHAFTVGNDIAFADGQYSPGSQQGQKLMAHELTHTVQQTGGEGAVQRKSDFLQRGSAGLFGGKCCNTASRVEWGLVGEGKWKKLEADECTGTTEDCDGMTCGGGFYRVDNMQTGSCNTPRVDDATFAPRRWTPHTQGSDANSPTQLGSTEGDTPPNWAYDSAATAACPDGVRTISVDLIKLDGATRSPAADLGVANRVFQPSCVRFATGASKTVNNADTTSWLGGDTDLNLAGITCPTPTAEESAMYTGATRKYGLSSRMRVFYPASTSGYRARAFSRPPYCAGGFANHAVIYPNALVDTLAHEFGHILLDSGDHASIDNPADTTNIMFAPGRTGSNLDASQISIVFGNA